MLTLFVFVFCLCQSFVLKELTKADKLIRRQDNAFNLNLVSANNDAKRLYDDLINGYNRWID